MQGPLAILSVGHNPTLLTHRHALLTRAGHSVISATQPIKAMKLMNSRDFDLIIVGLQGRAERRCIERLQNGKHVPIIFLCCDEFDAAVGMCTCKDASFSGEALLREISAAINSDQEN
jgi:DNA-binding response OmpR family regulator